MQGKKNISALFLILSFAAVYAQPDNDPPITPLLQYVTVIQPSGKARLKWSEGLSPDTKGYIVYYFRNGEAFAIDTLIGKSVTEFQNPGSFANARSESYVVAAIDTAGNVSPLSNALGTVFSTATLDSCNNVILIKWNSYSPVPYAVNGYRVDASVNGGSFSEAGSVSASSTEYSFKGFIAGNSYCFTVTALLQGAYESLSSLACLTVNMVRPPSWINLDYVTNADGKVALAFSYDPLSEINRFGIERQIAGESAFNKIDEIQGSPAGTLYTDSKQGYQSQSTYRISAINSCNQTAVLSNTGSAVHLSLRDEPDRIILEWTSYRGWRGETEKYKVLINTGEGFIDFAVSFPPDTALTVDYQSVMKDISSSEVCFTVEATEKVNPFGIIGISRSGSVCSETREIITVPNAFTPDGNLKNDKFKPVLSFSPGDYHLLITDMQNRKVFESRNADEEWDGRSGGTSLPRGVFIWYLRTSTPSGKVIFRSGTVTLL